jgi:ornithine cyclodeaminase/alanine dehydrogenase-like protein (mu-crystallin family)
LEAREIEQALSMAEAIGVVKDAFVRLSLKQAQGSSREITYFKSAGNAVQDVSAGRAVFQRGREKSLGREVELN